MKAIMLAASAVALCVGSARADVLVMAPGVDAQVLSAPGSIEFQLSPSEVIGAEKFTSYTITAIHCIMKANNPTSVLEAKNNGNFDSDVVNEIALAIGSGDPYTGVLTADNENDYVELNLLDGSLTFDETQLSNGVKITLSQTHNGELVELMNDDSYIVVEGNYSTDTDGEKAASVGQKHQTIALHDSQVDMEWSIGASPGGPNNGFGNNADAIDPSNSNYIKMIGKWYPSSKMGGVGNGVIIVDDDEM